MLGSYTRLKHTIIETKDDDLHHKHAPTRPLVWRNLSRLFMLLPWHILRDFMIYGLAVYGLYSILCQPLQDGKPTDIHQASVVVSTLQEKPSCSCGDSVAEAVSMGCKYDSLAAAWLPKHCRDDELTSEFETLGDSPDGSWIYYNDLNRTQVLSMEELQAKADTSNNRFYTNGKWHVVHCYFYWRKLFRSQVSGIVIENKYDNEGHIKHCGHVFMNEKSSIKTTGAMVALNLD